MVVLLASCTGPEPPSSAGSKPPVKAAARSRSAPVAEPAVAMNARRAALSARPDEGEAHFPTLATYKLERIGDELICS